MFLYSVYFVQFITVGTFSISVLHLVEVAVVADFILAVARKEISFIILK